VSLSEELARVAEDAARFADPDETVAAVLAAEPHPGARVYLCAFQVQEDGRRWLALDGSSRPVEERALVREAVSIAGLCEAAEETAGGGDLDELAARLVSVRLTENPVGIEDAEEAVRELRRTVGVPPVLASPDRLDELGAATRRLEQALGERASPFAEAMKAALPAVEALADDVEANYKRELV
jgi:hypothetical protein